MIHSLFLLCLITLLNLIGLTVIPLSVFQKTTRISRLKPLLLVPPISILFILGLVIHLFIDTLYTNIKERLNGN